MNAKTNQCEITAEQLFAMPDDGHRYEQLATKRQRRISDGRVSPVAHRLTRIIHEQSRIRGNIVPCCRLRQIAEMTHCRMGPLSRPSRHSRNGRDNGPILLWFMNNPS